MLLIFYFNKLMEIFVLIIFPDFIIFLINYPYLLFYIDFSLHKSPTDKYFINLYYYANFFQIVDFPVPGNPIINITFNFYYIFIKIKFF